MTSLLSKGRGFEVTNRARRGEDPAVGTRSRSRRFLYERLMQVSIRHTYYNSSDEFSPDFDVYPTPASKLLMKSLGLLFRIEEAGFSLLLDSNRKASLVRYLIRNGKEISGTPGTQFWTRLTVVLSLRNPYFLNFTQVPITTNPTTHNFYFTNQEAHEDAVGGRGSEVILNPGDYVNGSERLEMVPVSFPIKVVPNAAEIWIRSVAGRVVSCQPVCIPKSLVRAENPAKITCEEARQASGEEICVEVAYVNFAWLPEDQYTIEQVDKQGQPLEKIGPILYSVSYPQPLCLIDLMFTRPNPAQEGVYPVSDLFDVSVSDADQVEVNPVHYDLWFRRRKTFWNYYVTPRPQSVTLSNLRIEGDARFFGPCQVRLANGERAYRFLSEERLDLEEQPRQRLQLKGQNAETHEKIEIDRLPVAPIQKVLPRNGLDSCLNLLFSLCCEEPDERCLELLGRLCCSPASELGECLEVLLQLRERPADPEILERLESREESAQFRSYSDIYVYV